MLPGTAKFASPDLVSFGAQMLSLSFLLCGHRIRCLLFEFMYVGWLFDLVVLFRNSKGAVIKRWLGNACAASAKGEGSCSAQARPGWRPPGL